MNPNRREFLQVAGASVLAGFAGWEGGRGGKPIRPGAAAVAVVKASSYSVDLVDRMIRGIRECGLDVKDQNVLLKPNLVEFDPATCINTEVSVVAAALEAFRSLGAADVRIGEGPGHRRDTYAIAEMARYRSEIPKFDALFTDLNRDDVSAVQGFANRREIYLPNTALRADLVVSLAKMKTHHWAGATLSMKNFFGLVPGCGIRVAQERIASRGDSGIDRGAESHFPAEFRDRGRNRRDGRQRADSGDSEGRGRAGDGFRSAGGGRDVLPHHGHRPREGGVSANGGGPAGSDGRGPHPAAR